MKLWKKVLAATAASVCCLGFAQVSGFQNLLQTAEPVLSASAASGTYEDLTYSVNCSGEVTITDCDKTVTAVEIPAEIDGCPVTSIENAAFRRCSNLTDITIPESITYIGKEAFSYTPWLKARQAENPLVIVNHIVIDGQTCTGDVVIPDGVTSIANYAFSSDLGLATACSTQMTSVTIPDSVTRIGSSAFSGCKGLLRVVLPKSITTIEVASFYQCSSLTKEQYQPLDDYLDLSDDIWSDMSDVIEMFKYKDKHYVVPYCLSDPLLITYNRSLCEENGLDDPYELYKKDKWDWDAFMDMMKTFVSNAKDGETRYGINGWFGQAMVQSTGETFVKYDGSKFSNNISNPAIEEAEGVMEEIMSLGLYDPTWYGYLPDDGSTLFFGMADWALGASNVKADPNPDYEDDGFVEENDLMIVPFPKQPGSDEYYLNCNFGAKMLVKNSDKGDAVAAYIKCERLAAMIDEYKDAAKEKAIIPEVNAQGKLKSYVTEEQYDALQDYKNPKNITPVFDFGYGMGSRMYGDGEYTYETRGVMNNLTSALLNGDKDSWAVLRDEWSSVIDEVIDGYNNK